MFVNNYKKRLTLIKIYMTSVLMSLSSGEEINEFKLPIFIANLNTIYSIILSTIIFLLGILAFIFGHVSLFKAQEIFLNKLYNSNVVIAYCK